MNMDGNIMKKLVICVMLATLLLFTSCGSGISSDEAKNTLNDFVTCISQERYDDAVQLMHPSLGTTAEYLSSFITTVELGEGVDFSSGVEILGYDGFSSSLYNSQVDGARYELECNARIGLHRCEITIEIVKNDAGYGIYNFEVDVDD